MTKIQGVATNVKIALLTAISTIAVALIGAWQVAASATPADGPSRSEVRQMIQQEAPVNARGANELFTTLTRIDGKLTKLQVQVSVDHVLIQQIQGEVSTVQNSRP